MVKTSILILTKNEAENIATCLNGVYSQKAVDPFEVIVVDSGSADATLEIARQYPVRIESIPAESFHHARTRNFAASLATGEILVFLVADAIPVGDTWLQNLVHNFDDPSVGAVYGRQLPKNGSSLERQDALETVYGCKKIVKDPAHPNGLGYRFYHFSDVNAAIRYSVWRTTLFPEELRVFEDLGIAKRILNAGWKIVYEPESAVLHSHNHTNVGLFKRYFDIGYTLQALEIWNAPGTRKTMLRDIWSLMKKKVTRAGGANGAPIGKGLRQDIIKSAGLLLGLKQNYIPLPVKRQLSAFRVFDEKVEALRETKIRIPG
jgi:rhamnosyltransferase